MRETLGRAWIAALSAAALVLGGGLVTATAQASASSFPPRQMLGLFDSSYASLAARVSHLGYTPTSLTGTYGKMYTRDASVQAMAMLADGDDGRARAILRYLLRYSAATGQARLPHRIAEETNTLSSAQQTDTSVPAVALGGPHGGTQAMPAPGMVSAVDVWLSRGDGATGEVEATLLAGTGADATPVDTQTIAAADLPAAPGGWVTFEFLPPLFATPPAGYGIRLTGRGMRPGAVTWWGAGAGNASYRERVTDFHLSGYDMYDETDQLSSVALAWAKTYWGADSRYRDETFPLIRKFVDYYLDTPGYFSSELNLIRNPILDDEGYHNTYDLLTNVFTAEALHELAPVADRRGDHADAARYREFAARIEQGIKANLVTTVDGKRIYAEKYEIGATTEFHAGYSFVNLSPIAAQWYAMDRTLMANTVQAYFAHESKDWSGITMLSSMQDYAGSGHNRWVLSKSFAWELRFAAMTGNARRVGELDAFLRRYDPDVAQPVAEGWILDESGTVTLTDPGNQEHAGWYVLQLLRTYPALRGRTAEIDRDLRATPELTVSAPPAVTGQFTVDSTVFDTPYGVAGFHGPSLRVPDGWTVQTSSPQSGTLRRGDSATFVWTVTPSAGASGTVPLDVSVTLGGKTVAKRITTTVGASRA